MESVGQFTPIAGTAMPPGSMANRSAMPVVVTAGLTLFANAWPVETDPTGIYIDFLAQRREQSSFNDTSPRREWTMSNPENVLDKIVATKRVEIEQARSARPLDELRRQLRDAPPVRDFFSALAGEGPIKLIAEVKKASPSAGVIREDFDPLEIASLYQQHGASCISVLTDKEYFQGGLGDLRTIREHVSVPLLRKDFILDEYQLVEARVAGADAVLLIAECLDDEQLARLHREAIGLEMTPLVEFYHADNAHRVLQAGATLVGVNNRDLRTFDTNLEHSIRMREVIPEECLLVAESGIRGPGDVQKLAAAGVDAILVGEHLVAADNIGQAVDALMANVKEGG